MKITTQVSKHFHTQTGWPYWRVIFSAFLFVISGSCLLFGWMLFLAESLSSLWKYFFFVRIHCSVHIINSLLAANCMYSWAPYLFDNCKPPLNGLQWRAAYIFYFFYFIEKYRRRSVFPYLRFVEQTLLSHSIFFSITCTSDTGGIMMNRRQLWWCKYQVSNEFGRPGGAKIFLRGVQIF